MAQNFLELIRKASRKQRFVQFLSSVSTTYSPEGGIIPLKLNQNVIASQVLRRHKDLAVGIYVDNTVPEASAPSAQLAGESVRTAGSFKAEKGSGDWHRDASLDSPEERAAGVAVVGRAVVLRVPGFGKQDIVSFFRMHDAKGDLGDTPVSGSFLPAQPVRPSRLLVGQECSGMTPVCMCVYVCVCVCMCVYVCVCVLNCQRAYVLVVMRLFSSLSFGPNREAIGHVQVRCVQSYPCTHTSLPLVARVLVCHHSSGIVRASWCQHAHRGVDQRVAIDAG